MIYNEENVSLELTVEELCLRVEHPFNLDSPITKTFESDTATFIKYTKKANEFGNSQLKYECFEECQNTVMNKGLYYSVSTKIDRTYRLNNEGTVERYIETYSYLDNAEPTNYDIAIIKCNAYLFMSKYFLPSVKARLIFCYKDTKEIKVVEDYFKKDRLKEYFISLLDKFEFFGKFSVDRKLEVIPSAKKVLFPYRSVRGGQEEMIRTVRSGIKKQKRVFISAPTGIGKTVSSLYPSIVAIGEENVDKIFYLTAKNSTRREAFSAMKKMSESGLKIKTCAISSKESVCKKQTVDSTTEKCNSFLCEYSKDYYKKVNDALIELLSNYKGFTTNLIEEIAEKYKICPYELSLDLSEFCDVVVCDYNYVYNPETYLKRYFKDETEKKYVFLEDEAHNLPERAKEMYSISMKKSEVENVVESLTDFDSELVSALDSFLYTFDEAIKLCQENITVNNGKQRGYYISNNVPLQYEEKIDNILRQSFLWLKRNRVSSSYKSVKKLFSDFSKFKNVLSLFDEKYIYFVEVDNGDVSVSLNCLDPSNEIDRCSRRAISSIMFSATLEPIDYYVDMLGGKNSDIKVKLSSPFDEKNLLVITYDSISTRFEDREKTPKKIAQIIAGTVSGKAGNYMVFFPSYQYLEDSLDEFKKKYPDVKTVIQKRNMTRFEKEEFLSEFKNDEGVLRIGFCVLGGSFAEGIDLSGNRLIGSIIIGTGIPGLSNERNILKEYFDKTRENGYEYAYIYPGMNRVLQAAGRVIRTESDRGVVVLVDDRYSTEQYKNLFPMQWSNRKNAQSPSEIFEIVKNYWKNER